jgi:hypothetical protein
MCECILIFSSGGPCYEAQIYQCRFWRLSAMTWVLQTFDVVWVRTICLGLCSSMANDTWPVSIYMLMNGYIHVRSKLYYIIVDVYVCL